MTAVLAREGAVSGGVHLYPVRVYYEDTDAVGLVYHANYLRFAERARSEMLRCLGIEQERLRVQAGLAFVVRRCTVDYLRPARLDDDLVVATRLSALGGASLDLAQEIRRGAEPLVRLALKIACLDRSGRPTRLPAVLRTGLASLDGPTTRMVRTHAR